jgi:hypothetical protein
MADDDIARSASEHCPVGATLIHDIALCEPFEAELVWIR